MKSSWPAVSRRSTWKENSTEANRAKVAGALPEGTVLVEFVRFNPFDFKAIPAQGQSVWKPARYLAFVLLPGQPDNVRMIDLGEADPIDDMISDFRGAITGTGRKTERSGGCGEGRAGRCYGCRAQTS